MCLQIRRLFAFTSFSCEPSTLLDSGLSLPLCLLNLHRHPVENTQGRQQYLLEGWVREWRWGVPQGRRAGDCLKFIQQNIKQKIQAIHITHMYYQIRMALDVIYIVCVPYWVWCKLQLFPLVDLVVDLTHLEALLLWSQTPTQYLMTAQEWRDSQWALEPNGLQSQFCFFNVMLGLGKFCSNSSVK